MKRNLLALMMTTGLIAGNVAFAENVDSSAVMSPNCTEDQIKEIAGSALLSISKNQSWGDEVKGYIISLDTSKMSYGELTKKMLEAKCFDKPESDLNQTTAAASEKNE